MIGTIFYYDSSHFSWLISPASFLRDTVQTTLVVWLFFTIVTTSFVIIFNRVRESAYAPTISGVPASPAPATSRWTIIAEPAALCWFAWGRSVTNWRHYLGNDDITGISSVRIIIEPRAFTVDKRAGPEGLSFRSVKYMISYQKKKWRFHFSKAFHSFRFKSKSLRRKWGWLGQTKKSKFA